MTYCVQKCKKIEYLEFDHSGTLSIVDRHGIRDANKYTLKRL